MSDDYSSDKNTTGVLVVGGSKTGNIEILNDRDWFSINLKVGLEYVFKVAPARQSVANIFIYNRDGDYCSEGVSLIMDTTGALPVFYLTGFVAPPISPDISGDIREFFVEVSFTNQGLQTGGYTLSADLKGGIVIPSLTNPGDDYIGSKYTSAVLQIGGTRTGVIEKVGDQDWFKMSLVKNTSYYFAVCPLGMHVLVIGLFDKSGNTVLTASDISFHYANGKRITYIESFTASQTGTYFLAAASGLGAPMVTGPYSVLANKIDTPLPDIISPTYYPPGTPPVPDDPPLPVQPEYEEWVAANQIVIEQEPEEVEGIITGKILNSRGLGLAAKVMARKRSDYGLAGANISFSENGEYAVYVPTIGIEYFVIAKLNERRILAKDRILAMRSPTNFNLELANRPYYFADMSHLLGTMPAAVSVTYSSDGLTMYACSADTYRIYSFSLTTPYDPQTATLLGYVVWDSPGSNSAPFVNGAGADILFSADELTGYIWDDDNRTLFQYGLTIAGDISTLFYQGRLMQSSSALNTLDITITPDGTKIHILSAYQESLRQHNLSVPWQLPQTQESAFYNPGDAQFIPTNHTGLYSYIFTPAGDKIIFIRQPGATGGAYLQAVTLSVPWDISTVTSQTEYYYPFLMPGTLDEWLDGGETLLISDGMQFARLILSAPYDISAATFPGLKWVEKAFTGNGPMCFSPDGTNLFLAGDYSGRIDQYSLSTPWDISTASLVHSNNIGPYYADSITMRPDGSALYIIGGATAYVYTITMPTPMDISSATGYSMFQMPGVNDIYGISISDNGLILGILQVDATWAYKAVTYNLATPWVVSSAVFKDDINITEAMDGNVPNGGTVTPGGKWLVIFENRKCFFFQLAVLWDMSTAVFHKAREMEHLYTNLSIYHVPCFNQDGLHVFINNYEIITQWEIPALI